MGVWHVGSPLSYDNTSVPILEILRFLSRCLGRNLLRHAIERGPTHLRHRTNILDREMIGVSVGQEIQGMHQAWVMRRIGSGASVIDPPSFCGRNPFNLALVNEIRIKLGNAR